MSANGYQEQALDVYKIMVAEGNLPTHITFASVLSACGSVLDLELGRRCHGLVIKIGLDKNIFVSNGLLSVYAKCGVMREAVKVFKSIDKHNERIVGNNLGEVSVVSWNIMIAGSGQKGQTCAKCGDVETARWIEAIELFRKMQFQSIKLDRTIATIIFGSCAAMDFVEGGRQVHAALQKVALHTDVYIANGLISMSYTEFNRVHSLIVKDGYSNDVYVSTALIDMYCKCGDIDGTRKYFDMMPLRNTVTWIEMIHGYAQNGLGDEAIRLSQDMVSSAAASTLDLYATDSYHSRYYGGSLVESYLPRPRGEAPLIETNLWRRENNEMDKLQPTYASDALAYYNQMHCNQDFRPEAASISVSSRYSFGGASLSFVESELDYPISPYL
ncbi:hypothetical protein COLO4_36077 [Corchorus olitorius]|uniref:Pentatricopeptide repeat-containing protein n=1 Tax=Corchorus olitorius TaxID=93759 RepID=A0A1R3GB13_9ROSI|nr:hypothetical protein COLO4_36077 [Corchorus olitorius]